jgi:hypothetical protein
MLFLQGEGLSQAIIPPKFVEFGSKPIITISTWTGTSMCA